MTRKHFKAIAEIINDAGDDVDAVERLAGDLASYFKSENPNFDRDRFLTACGF